MGYDYVELRDKHGGIRPAARIIDIPESSFRRHLKKQEEAAAINKLGLKMVDAEHAIIDDLGISGTSRYYKLEDGGIWIKTEKSKVEEIDHFKMIGESILKEVEPLKSVPLPPKHDDDDLMSAYVLSDFHLGMFSNHDPEGPWTTEIAREMLYKWFDYVIDNSMNTHTAVFLQLGDFFHCNGTDSRTPQSKHVLDTDVTWGQVVDIGMEALEYGIEKMLKKHQHVHLIMAEANHDPDAAIWMQRWFNRLYKDEPRITVDCTNSGYYVYEWGKTSIWAHHGHQRNIDNLSKTLIAMYPDVFGKTKYRIGHIGHFHHAKRKAMGDDGLLDLKIHTTLAAKDQYAVTRGYMSQRGTEVNYYSKRFGPVGTLNITPGMLI